MIVSVLMLLLLVGQVQPGEAAYGYDAAEHLWRIELSAGQTYRVAAWDVPPQHVYFEALAWSPSGEWLAWVSVSAAGSVQPGMTHLSGYATRRPDFDTFDHVTVHWLPDEDWLLYVGSRQVAGRRLLGVRVYDVPADHMRVRFDWPFTELPQWVTSTGIPGPDRSCTDCRYTLPAHVIERIETLTRNTEDCQAELVRTSSHSTLLIYAQPERDVFQPVGSLQGTCYGICQTSLPVIGQLQDSAQWYQVRYNADVAWIDIQDDGRLVGNCAALPVVPLPVDD